MRIFKEHFLEYYHMRLYLTKYQYQYNCLFNNCNWAEKENWDVDIF